MGHFFGDCSQRSFRTVLVGTLVMCAACGDDAQPALELSAGGDMSLMCTGAPATGPLDKHCEAGGALELVTVDPSRCTAPGDDTSDYGDTLSNLSAYDDDCKYVVSYTVDPVCRNAGTYFNLVLKDATTGALVPNAKPRAEAFLTDTHPAPNSGATFVESSPGVYKLGPIVFDAAGTWTVRFHFFASCTDSPSSPHGHAAFYILVP